MNEERAVRESAKPFDDLPLLSELADPTWGDDVSGFVDDVFSREYQGLLRSPDGSLVAYRNGDIRGLMADPLVGNIPAAVMAQPLCDVIGGKSEGWERFIASNIISMETPLHAPARQLFARQMTRGRVGEFQALAARVVREVAEEAFAASKVDFQQDYAAKVATRFWRYLVGFSAEEEELLWRVTDEIVTGFYEVFTVEQAHTADRAAAEYMDVLSAAIQREIERGENEMLLEMAADFDEFDLPDKPASVGDLVAGSLYDGVHTTKVAITNVVFCLLDDPGTRRQVEEDTGLINSAVAEGLRLYSPVAITPRFTSDDVVHGGLQIPKGTAITMLWHIGNRDPEVFPEPNTFRLGRALRPQFAFGGGAQICPGRHAATLLADSVLRMWFEEPIQIELVEPARWRAGSPLVEVESLPVAMSR